MKVDTLVISVFHTDKIYFNNVFPVSPCPPTDGGFATDFLDRFYICRRKQNRAPDSPPPSEKPQATGWLLAAFLSFDSIPHNSLKSDRELWGILSNWLACFRPLVKKTSTLNKKAHFVTSLWYYAYELICDSSRCYKHTEISCLSSIMPETACAYARPSFLFPMIRGPPLLKF